MGTKVDSCGELIVFCCGPTLHICNRGGEKIETLILQESCEGSNGKAVNDSNHVSCIRFSPDGSLLGIATDSKMLYIWNTKTWQLLGTKKMIKRPMALYFDPKLSEVLLADKTGDVYSFPLVNGVFKEEGGNSNNKKSNGNSVEDDEMDKEIVPILGHLSMLLDMIITNDGRYIITCDRDEKIRVSKFPNSYDIQTFCLGHTEFVTKIVQLPTDTLNILSCSGDGSLKLWNPENGTCEASFDTSEAVAPELMTYFKQAVSKLQASQKAEENKKQTEDNINVRTIPIIPAIQIMTIHAEGSTTLVALTLDRIPGIFFYKIEGCSISFIASKELPDSILAMTWMDSGELVTVKSSANNPVSVMMLNETKIVILEDHALVKFGKSKKDLFQGYLSELSLDSYYKQRYDNVADYLRKKEERIAGTKRSTEDETPHSKISRISINETL